jgi:cytosine deaminase
VKARAWKTLKWQIANGIQFVRTHVDVSDPTLTALKAMLEVKQEVAPWVELQIVAFPGGYFLLPQRRGAAGRGPALGADVVGRSRILSSPVNMAWNRCISLFRLAKKYDRPLDIHCDEIDDEQSRFVETVAALALRGDRPAGDGQPYHRHALL